jgi:hypothetical protein
MAINFPSNPAVNQTFSNGSDAWIWNGFTWEVKPVSSPSFTTIAVSTLSSGDSSEISVSHKTTFASDVAVENDLSVNGVITAGRLQGTLTGNVVGTATSANTLATARTINGTSFNGSSNITVSAAANTLTGTSLNNTVTDSNLNTVGVLTELEVSGDITADANVIVATTPAIPTHAANKKYVDTRSIAMSIAMS